MGIAVLGDGRSKRRKLIWWCKLVFLDAGLHSSWLQDASNQLPEGITLIT